jgi:hypothetical protein
MSATSNVITHLGREILKPEAPTDFWCGGSFSADRATIRFFCLAANKQDKDKEIP